MSTTPNTVKAIMLTISSTLATTAIISAVGSIQEDFEIRNAYLSAFIVSAYVLGFAAGPLVILPLAENLGDVLPCHFCNVLSLTFNCWCAKTKSWSMFALARFLAGCEGAVSQSLAARSIGNMSPRGASRLLMIAVALANYLPPTIGPLVGSHIYINWGWHWVFWITAIMGGFCTVFGFARSETHEAVLLRIKAAKKRRLTHNRMLYTPFDARPGHTISANGKKAFLQMLRILVLPSFFLTSCVPATGFAFLYIVYITLPQVLPMVYTWPSKNIGLAYLGIAVRIIIATVTGIATSESYARLRTAKIGIRAEDRLVLLLCLWPLTGLGLFLYGYFLHRKIHWVGSVTSLGSVGAGVIFAIVRHNLHAARPSTNRL